MSFCTVFSFLLLVTMLNDVNAEVDTRIINGTTAHNDHYPYMVSLRIFGTFHLCGGSIVSRRWVLTSALCLSLTTNLLVVVGTKSLSSGGVMYQINDIIRHPLFNYTTMTYDAGLVKTTKNIQYSRNVLPIYLAHILPAVGTVGALTGWGLTSYPQPSFPDKLQVLKTEVIEHSICVDLVSPIGYNIGDAQFCTFKNQSGGCYDSGGPLVVRYYKQIGILSFGGCVTGIPDVYTSIPMIRKWIMTYI